MRKLILLAFLIYGLSIASSATTVKIGELCYELNEDNLTASVTYEKWPGSNNYQNLTSVEIPERIEYQKTSYTVTSIGFQAFIYSNLTSIKIPNSVTSIEKVAFEACAQLENIEIGDGVISIGDGAFYGCSSLNQIIIPNSVKTIGEAAFAYCYNLKEVEIGNQVTRIEKDVFIFCENLTTLTFYDSLKEIDPYAFNYKTDNLKSIKLNILDINQYFESGSPVMPGLTSNSTYSISEIQYFFEGSPIKNIIVPMGVKKIADYAFYWCETLESVIFPDNLKQIGNSAFRRCTNLYNMTIPSELESIGDIAFNGCRSINEISIPKTLLYLGENSFSGCGDLEKVNIDPECRFTSISNHCFSSCGRLKSINLPESIISIGSYAFKGCASLIIESLPKYLEVIGEGAFAAHMTGPEDNEYLVSSGPTFRNFKLPQSIKSIGNEAFRNTLNIPTLYLPEGLESVGGKAFENCGIKKLILPNSLSFIGSEAFIQNSFSEVTIPSSMTEISKGAFKNCSSLYKVNFSSNVKIIGPEAFYGTGIRTLTLPSPIEIIGEAAFYASGIINVKFPETLTSIGDRAFAQTAMVSFEIPNNVSNIGQNALGTLHYLKMGTGFNDFSIQFCSGTDVLEMVSPIPPSLPVGRLGFTPNMVLVPEGSGPAYTSNTRWKEYNIVAKNSNKAVVWLNESGTLAEQIRLQTGLMPGAVTNLRVEGAALNNEDFAIIRSNMPACYEVDLSSLPNLSMPAGVLSGKNTLVSIILPAKTEIIEENAFANCYSAKIDIPSGVKTIGKNAFLNCESLNCELKFNNLASIGIDAFKGCRSLMRIDLSSLEDLTWSPGAFNECYGLSEILLPSKLTSIPPEMFCGTALTDIQIPATTVMGQNAFKDCNLLHTVVLEDGFNGLGTGCFSNCTALENITLPSSITYLAPFTFSGCTNLQELNLPASITTMGESTFQNSGLNYIVIPNSIKTIPTNCFNRCDILYAIIDGGSEINSNAFADCPQLIVINLPFTLTKLESSSLNSSSLSAINSPSITPSAANGNPFPDVSSVTCALSIPKPSFSSYLSAEYWGKFINIRNCIDVTITSTDSGQNEIPADQDTGVDLTYMDEGDYQEMLEEMEDDEVELIKGRRKALSIMRAHGVADINRGYGKLFNNASLFLDEYAVTRFFISLAEDVTSFSVSYNGRDITDQVDPNTMSFVIDGLESNGNLIINANGHVNGIENIISDKNIDIGNAPYYNLNGQIVKNPTPGIYIRGGKKVIIR